jgi:hypothetical protein
MHKLVKKFIPNFPACRQAWSFLTKNRSLFTFVLVVAVITIVSYGGYNVWDEVNAGVSVSQKEIVLKVSKHIDLPNEEPQEVVRVQDAQSLQAQNDFYKDVKEGDYILMYKNMAVIYDLRNDVVVAFRRGVKPSF